MSDGIVRTCNLHGHELRLIGPDLVCPQGHDCPVDWTVKTLPYADPHKRLCPIHGSRLIGAGDILDCEQYGHQVSTRISDRPRAITQFVPPPAPGDRGPIAQPPQERKPEMPVETVLKEHGTAGRYWQKCRCQPCKSAVNEHVRKLKIAQRAREGKPAPQRRATNPPPVQKKPAKSAAPAKASKPMEGVVSGSITAIGEIAARIAGLRAALVEAEVALALEVNGCLHGWELVQKAPQ